VYDIFKNWETENLHMKVCKFIIESGKEKYQHCSFIRSRETVHISFHSFFLFFAILSFCHRLEDTPRNSLIWNAYKENMILYSFNINCLFLCLFWVAQAIFQLFVTITSARAANLDICLALTAFSGEGSFTSTCHTYSDTGTLFLRSYLTDPWLSFWMLCSWRRSNHYLF
jgi:hypothetical protein